MYTGETINVNDACLGCISALSTTIVLVVVLMIVVAIFFDRRSNQYKEPLEWLACREQTESCREQTESDGGHCCSKSRTVNEYGNIEKRHSDTSDGLHGTGVTPGSLLTTSFSSSIPSLCKCCEF